MKNILRFIILMSMTMGVSQTNQDDKLNIEKGTWTIGGNLSFGTSTISNSADILPSTSESKSSSFAVLPNVGYAVGNNTILGLRPGYIYQKADNAFIDPVTNSFLTSETNGLSIATYLRRFFPLNKNFAFYLQGELGYEHIKSDSFDDENDSVNSENRTNAFSIGVRPGMTYFVSKRFALEAGLGLISYFNADSELTDNSGTIIQRTETNGFSFAIDSSQLFLGLSYYF